MSLVFYNSANNLQKLCLRQNHILDIEALEALAGTLVDLDLYDNKIGHIHGLEELMSLENLDLSFNKIKHIKRINHLVGLKNLYFVQNRITRIEGLEGMTVLRNLELGANRIREIENIDHLTALEELWLGKNKITELKVRLFFPLLFFGGGVITDDVMNRTYQL